jgi:hypothetical protein
MIKFIIEVSEEYVREHANVDNIKSKIEEKGGKNALGMLIDSIAWGKVERDLGDGDKEYTIKKEGLDDKLSEAFDNAIGTVALMATIGQKDEAEGE